MPRPAPTSKRPAATMVKIEADAFDAGKVAIRYTSAEEDELSDDKAAVKREAEASPSASASASEDDTPRKKPKTAGGGDSGKANGARRKTNGTHDAKPRRERTGGTGKRWSPAELDALLVAATKGASSRTFEGTVPGRTANQCAMTWRNTVLPRLRKTLGAAEDAARPA